MSKALDKRVESESQGISRICNDSLMCKDCEHRLDDTHILGNTSKCTEYSLKPNQVLSGGSCIKYDKGS